MSQALGEKSKFLTLLDNQAAEELIPLYSIDIHLGKSPKKGVKSGALSVFKLNEVDLKMPEKYDFTQTNPKVLKEIKEAHKRASESTEILVGEPLMFKETEGRWIQWAIEEALRIYDQYNGNARISLKCPKLKIQMRRSSKEVANLRSNIHDLFPVAWEIDRLLDKDYSFDPWSNRIRRGRINALMSKR